jgi:hypothetical protein
VSLVLLPEFQDGKRALFAAQAQQMALKPGHSKGQPRTHGDR